MGQTKVLTYSEGNEINIAVDFDEVFQKLKINLISYCKRVINDTYLIENIVQDAFLKLWQFRETITNYEHAERFLRQSVKWACHAYFRNSSSRFHRNMVQLDALESPDKILSINPEASEPDDDLYQRRVRSVLEAIDKICYGREKEVMELHFIKGLTHSKIAERYGLSVRTVTIILDKGKMRLKTVLLPPLKRDVAFKPLNGMLANFDKIEGLTTEQNVIYQLRLVGKYNFAAYQLFSIYRSQRSNWNISTPGKSLTVKKRKRSEAVLQLRVIKRYR